MMDFIYREIEGFKAAPMWRKVTPVAVLVVALGIVVMQLTGVIGGSDPLS